jgi:NAD(P)H-dependent nitrite reductase small subunit
MTVSKEFIRLCPVDDLKEKSGKRFIIGNTEIAIFKVDGKIYALSNICPHQHTALIYDGFIEDDCVVCPVHGWIFELQTGKLKTGGKGLDSYEVNVVDNMIYVKVKQIEFNW